MNKPAPIAQYKNDGKQNEQSHEGHATLTGSGADYWWIAEMAAYGTDEDGVRKNLREGLDEQIARLLDIRASLDLVNKNA